MAKDPYRYFRVEAREIVTGLQAGALDLERGAATREAVSKLLRLAHTLKGAARVVRLTEIAQLAHHVEDVLEPFRAAAGAVSQDAISEVLRSADTIAARLAAIDSPQTTESIVKLASTPTEAPQTSDPTSPETSRLKPELVGPLARRSDERLVAVSVPIAALDGVLDAVVELRARVHGVARQSDRTSSEIAQALEALDRELAVLHGDVSELRLIPVEVLTVPLERVVRDTALALGKRVELRVRGSEVTLDAPIVFAVQEALVQLMRNAVAHGIEDVAERERQGKTSLGQVEVTISRTGSRVSVRCSDDGRGIDVAAVRRAAVGRALMTSTEAAALDLAGAIELLLRGGVTTAGALTEVAGRGVGLDVVRDVIDRVSGEIDVTSEPGRGTAITLTVPVSLAALSSLGVEAAGERFLLPVDALHGVERVAVEASDLLPESVVIAGDAVRFVPLTSLLGGEPAPRPAWTAVVLRGRDRRLALGVDRLQGTVQAVLRPLPTAVGRAPLIAGASVDIDGSPVLMLDPAALIEAASAPRERVVARPPVRRAILVIDDSLTTRMLEQTILTAAGYEVDLATSAEEGLAKARERRYGLFIVDVEMPGMDGFEFVERTRSDAQLRVTPAILVTSRNTPEDRRRGELAGASAYVVKGEFHEGRLLELVARLSTESA